MSTRTCSENEAEDKSEMAYWLHWRLGPVCMSFTMALTVIPQKLGYPRDSTSLWNWYFFPWFSLINVYFILLPTKSCGLDIVEPNSEFIHKLTAKNYTKTLKVRFQEWGNIS